MFTLPEYHAPDFSGEPFLSAPDAQTALANLDGVAPEGYHSTSIYPEYFKIDGQWRLAGESRMDCSVVIRPGGGLDVVENRGLRAGDRVVTGRTEDGSEGIYLHTGGFGGKEESSDRFAFRTSRSRETAFSRDYDFLCGLLDYEREHGRIIWVMGPAFAFDRGARSAMQSLVERGYVHGLMAGNALAAHDLEASLLGTALGQDVYTQRSMPGGHYNHLDVINRARRLGSIPKFIEQYHIKDGIMYSLVKHGIPFVLTGSIRDDGPLPGVIGDAYAGQAAMRDMVRPATTIICLATMLHSIAAGNMTPSFRVVKERVRPLYLYCVDISEFVANKLADRGSLSAVSMVTNARDFIVNVAENVGKQLLLNLK